MATVRGSRRRAADAASSRSDEALHTAGVPDWRVGSHLLVLSLGGVTAASATPAIATTYTITDLGPLGDGVSRGYGSNATGQVTSGSYLLQTVQMTGCPGGYNTNRCVEHPEHAFLYSNGSMSDLGTLGGVNSKGRAINRSAELAGLPPPVRAGCCWSARRTGGRYEQRLDAAPTAGPAHRRAKREHGSPRSRAWSRRLVLAAVFQRPVGPRRSRAPGTSASPTRERSPRSS
jgi:probable HAF family extracellular repeat protein